VLLSPLASDAALSAATAVSHLKSWGNLVPLLASSASLSSGLKDKDNSFSQSPKSDTFSYPPSADPNRSPSPLSVTSQNSFVLLKDSNKEGRKEIKFGIERLLKPKVLPVKDI